jgi:DNA-binding transcriptional LysR family regulator
MMIMRAMHDAPDFDLLAVFAALYRERHLTRAALRLGKSQPATSRALERLRALMGDALFVRAPRGMLPTPRADALAAEVDRILESARALVYRDRFEPSALKRTFVIGTSDLVEAELLRPLSAELTRRAPGIDLSMKQLVLADAGDALAEGRLDLVIAPDTSLPASVMRQHLFDGDFLCAVRLDHPRARRKLSLETYLSLLHVQIAPRGEPGGPVDDALATRGLSRRVAVRTPSFLAAPLLVAQSDYVLTAPALMLRPLARPLGLRLHEPPLTFGSFRIFQAWHPRTQDDAAHRWFRGLVAEVTRK